jgi:hypothetical protein
VHELLARPGTDTRARRPGASSARCFRLARRLRQIGSTCSDRL